MNLDDLQRAVDSAARTIGGKVVLSLEHARALLRPDCSSPPARGRTTPPTLEEIEAHDAAHGGRWLVSHVEIRGFVAPLVLHLRGSRTPTYVYVYALFPGYDLGGELGGDPPWWSKMRGSTFTPLRDGHPCTWPLVDDDIRAGRLPRLARPCPGRPLSMSFDANGAPLPADE